MSITEEPTGTIAPLSPPPLEDGAHLCVLASGSAGNCSVLVMRRRGQARAILLDLGLSPRRTFRFLSEMGLGPHQLDGALVTHLDHDHLHAGWRTQMPGHARVHMHEHHADRVADGRWVVAGFDGEFDLDPDVRVRPLMMSHDEQGVATFRIDFTEALARERARVSLGFATDLGHIHARMVDHFRGTNPSGNALDGEVADDPVDVLAIESNYCPVMQHASTRSDFLKQRIMGGHGHLSNQEALSAVLQIEPRDHVVLLHLSRECNDPAVVASLHAGADYALTITSQERPSRWVRIGGTSPRELRPCARPSLAVNTTPRPTTLWDHAEPRV